MKVGDRVRHLDIPMESGVIAQIADMPSGVRKLCVMLDGERLIYDYEDEFELEVNDSYSGYTEVEIIDVVEE